MSCLVYGQSKMSVYLSVFTLKIYLRRVQQREYSRSLAKICVADIGKDIGQVLALLNRPLTIHTKYELGKFNCVIILCHWYVVFINIVSIFLMIVGRNLKVNLCHQRCEKGCFNLNLTKMFKNV